LDQIVAGENFISPDLVIENRYTEHRSRHKILVNISRPQRKEMVEEMTKGSHHRNCRETGDDANGQGQV
jgi:hypothetical protein